MLTSFGTHTVCARRKTTNNYVGTQRNPRPEYIMGGLPFPWIFKAVSAISKNLRRLPIGNICKIDYLHSTTYPAVNILAQGAMSTKAQQEMAEVTGNDQDPAAAHELFMNVTDLPVDPDECLTEEDKAELVSAIDPRGNWGRKPLTRFTRSESCFGSLTGH